MKSLFDENFRYTPAAIDIANDIDMALALIFNRRISEGYSPREIAHVIQGEVSSYELTHVLNIQNDRKV